MLTAELVEIIWHASCNTVSNSEPPSENPLLPQRETLGKQVPITRDIYPNLKLRMYTSGIRQNRLAKMVGIDEAHLSKIVNGFREPNPDLRTQIAEILHCDPEWLFHKVLLSEESPEFDHQTWPPNK
jgi:DNA-binding XRE family transcriptional regulator